MSHRPDMPSIQPLPDHEAFLTAYSLIDEPLGKDGAWRYVAYLADELNKNYSDRQRYLEVAAYGRFLREDDLDDSHVPAAPLQHFLVGKAFAQGFLQQLGPAQLIYSDRYTLNNATEMLHRNYRSQEYITHVKDEEELRKEHGVFTMALGEYGLSRLDEEAGRYIHKWSTEAYELDSRLQHAFRLGHGAMIVCGVDYQKGVNEYVLSVLSHRENIDEEINTLFATGSGEGE